MLFGKLTASNLPVRGVISISPEANFPGFKARLPWEDNFPGAGDPPRLESQSPAQNRSDPTENYRDQAFLENN